jgi:hypothetical protein
MKPKQIILWTAGVLPYLGFIIGFPPLYRAIQDIGTPAREESVAQGLALFPFAVTLGFGAGFLFFCIWLILKTYEAIQKKKN